MASSKNPPPLPPRQPSTQSLGFEDAPPSYDSVLQASSSSSAGPWMRQDQRSSSQQSLAPSESNQQNERRKLLMIYIHGFMGNETSFRSFPAHVHHLLTTILAETHVIHTKIYPRYRSKRNISFARDDFSKWLEPHEDPTTDVVLLGHSMGGLLAAEVALMPADAPASRPLKHRILGTVNFDVPFLGMHPGIIKSGLASIFKPSEETHGDKYSPGLSPTPSADGGPTSPLSLQTSTSNEDFWNSQDPNFNPKFQNDVVLPVRKGWRNAWHFVNKHSGELGKATKQLVASHMEFGGAMANYGELKTRYARIRALEEDSVDVRKSVLGDAGQGAPRVRFVNYWTASTGRPKKVRAPVEEQLGSNEEANASTEPGDLEGASITAPDITEGSMGSGPSSVRRSSSGHRTTDAASAMTVDSTEYGLHADTCSETSDPRISLEGGPLADMTYVPPKPESDSDGEAWSEAAESLTISGGPSDTASIISPPPSELASTIPDIESNLSQTITPASTTSPSIASPSLKTLSTTERTMSSSKSLPPIPDPPTKPPELNTSFISDPATKKLVEKEHANAMKLYQKALKNREKMIADRQKLEEKMAKKQVKDASKAEKDALKAQVKGEKDALKAEKDRQKEMKKEKERSWKLERKETEKEISHLEREEMRLQQERERMEAEARRMRGEPDPPHSESAAGVSSPVAEATISPPSAHRSVSDAPSASSRSQRPENEAKPQKDRTFCVLPPADSNGERDPCWIRVFMRDVDEVGAHCGLFFVDERYERLVGEVAERVEAWVLEDLGKRKATGEEEIGMARGREKS